MQTPTDTNNSSASSLETQNAPAGVPQKLSGSLPRMGIISPRLEFEGRQRLRWEWSLMIQLLKMAWGDDLQCSPQLWRAFGTKCTSLTQPCFAGTSASPNAQEKRCLFRGHHELVVSVEWRLPGTTTRRSSRFPHNPEESKSETLRAFTFAECVRTVVIYTKLTMEHLNKNLSPETTEVESG